MTTVSGRRFWKMSGSGNDFVFFDARTEDAASLQDPATVRRICARATGVGADGVVFIQHDSAQAFRILYLNQDGSIGELCGNASLCAVRLAFELGIASPSGVAFGTDAGVVSGRLRGGAPEIDLQPPRDLELSVAIPLLTGERRMGYVDTGVPHVVVLVDDVETVDLDGRGRSLRHHSHFPRGANANFLSRSDPTGPWSLRTFERGVEGETLACGTGTVAAAVLLAAWGLSGSQTSIRSRSGGDLLVTLGTRQGVVEPSLRGEGRIVFSGSLASI